MRCFGEKFEWRILQIAGKQHDDGKNTAEFYDYITAAADGNLSSEVPSFIPRRSGLRQSITRIIIYFKKIRRKMPGPSS
jgi:hypothetical protein